MKSYDMANGGIVSYVHHRIDGGGVTVPAEAANDANSRG
jgi:hypothetical protein